MWKLCGVACICWCVLVINLFKDALSVFLFQVQVLRNAGEEVTLTVSFLKRAPAFLKLPLNEDCACKPLLLGQKKTQFNAHETWQLPNLLCVEVDWHRLFLASIAAWIWAAHLAGSCSNIQIKQKIGLCQKNRSPCIWLVWISRVAGKTVELH